MSEISAHYSNGMQAIMFCFPPSFSFMGRQSSFGTSNLARDGYCTENWGPTVPVSLVGVLSVNPWAWHPSSLMECNRTGLLEVNMASSKPA